jgi:DME family drug/metabolite transporter
MPDRRVAVLAVLAAAVLFGTAGTAQALGPDDTTPLTLGAVRGGLGALTLWVLARRWPGRWLWPHTRPILVGGAGVAVYQPAFLEAVTRSGVAVGTIVTIGSAPFAAGVLDRVVLGRRPSGRWLVATVVTVAGCVLLVASQSGVAGVEVDVLGVLAALAAGAGYAVYSTTSKLTIGRGLDPTVALAAPFTLGSALLVLVSLGDPATWLGTPGGLVLAVYLGVAATGLAYALYGRGLRSLPSSTAVTLVLAEPVTAAVLAVVVLDEAVPALGWLGIAVVLVGLTLASRSAVGPSTGARRRGRPARGDPRPARRRTGAPGSSH